MLEWLPSHNAAVNVASMSDVLPSPQANNRALELASA